MQHNTSHSVHAGSAARLTRADTSKSYPGAHHYRPQSPLHRCESSATTLTSVSPSTFRGASQSEGVGSGCGDGEGEGEEESEAVSRTLLSSAVHAAQVVVPPAGTPSQSVALSAAAVTNGGGALAIGVPLVAQVQRHSSEFCAPSRSLSPSLSPAPSFASSGVGYVAHPAPHPSEESGGGSGGVIRQASSRPGVMTNVAFGEGGGGAITPPVTPRGGVAHSMRHVALEGLWRGGESGVSTQGGGVSSGAPGTPRGGGGGGVTQHMRGGESRASTQSQSAPSGGMCAPGTPRAGEGPHSMRSVSEVGRRDRASTQSHSEVCAPGTPCDSSASTVSATLHHIRLPSQALREFLCETRVSGERAAPSVQTARSEREVEGGGGGGGGGGGDTLAAAVEAMAAQQQGLQQQQYQQQQQQQQQIHEQQQQLQRQQHHHEAALAALHKELSASRAQVTTLETTLRARDAQVVRLLELHSDVQREAASAIGTLTVALVKTQQQQGGAPLPGSAQPPPTTPNQRSGGVQKPLRFGR